MNATNAKSGPVPLAGIGFIAGLAIVAVDNFAFEGEVSPIVIVILLLTVTAGAGWVWGRKGWPVCAVTWVCVPLAHVIKRMFGLPDTLHPNTYLSILMLAVFTFVVAAIGTGVGLVLRRLTTDGRKRNSGTA